MSESRFILRSLRIQLIHENIYYMKYICLFTTLLMSFCTFAVEKRISVKEMQSILRSQLPRELCGDKQYFRACFSSSRTECLKQGATVTETCLTRGARLPASFKSDHQLTLSTYAIGRCAGKDLEKKLSKYKKENKECLNANSWWH